MVLFLPLFVSEKPTTWSIQGGRSGIFVWARSRREGIGARGGLVCVQGMVQRGGPAPSVQPLGLSNSRVGKPQLPAHHHQRDGTGSRPLGPISNKGRAQQQVSLDPMTRTQRQQQCLWFAPLYVGVQYSGQKAHTHSSTTHAPRTHRHTKGKGSLTSSFLVSYFLSFLAPLSLWVCLSLLPFKRHAGGKSSAFLLINQSNAFSSSASSFFFLFLLLSSVSSSLLLLYTVELIYLIHPPTHPPSLTSSLAP